VDLLPCHVSRRTECRESRQVTVTDAKKSPKISYFAMVRKVERDLESVYPGPDYHQQLISSFE